MKKIYNKILSLLKNINVKADENTTLIDQVIRAAHKANKDQLKIFEKAKSVN